MRNNKTLPPSSPRGVPFITAQVDFLLNETLPKRAATPRTPREPPGVYRTVRSRFGDFALPEEPRTPRRSVKRQTVVESVVEERVREQPVTVASAYVTLPLLKTMKPANCSVILMKTPVFLRTLHQEGKLDPATVATISLSLTATALVKFVGNMSQESNFYGRVMACKSVFDVEKVLCELLPIQRATVWMMTESSSFVLSQTLNQVLPLRRSIVGYSMINNVDIVTTDPGNHPGFCVDVDSAMLRNCRSMMLLPIRSPPTKAVAVIQIVGMCNAVSSQQVPISDYHQEVFKVVRDIVEKRFFSAARACEVDAGICNVFSQFQTTHFGEIVARFTKFMQDAVPCDIAEIYQFNDREKTMTRLTDGRVFDEATGGIAFAAGVSKEPVSCYHQQKHPKFNDQIDGLLTNKSVLALSVYSTRAHYVLVLRAKWKSPAFVPKDLAFLKDVGPVICETLRASSGIDRIVESDKVLARKRLVAGVVCESINQYYGTRADAFAVLADAAKKMFESDYCFVCDFTGREMRYRPKDVTIDFDACISGHAYNHRSVVQYSDSEFDETLYQRLDIKVNNAVAFPFRSKGQVVGAIELVNCNVALVDDFGMTNICGLASFLLGSL